MVAPETLLQQSIGVHDKLPLFLDHFSPVLSFDQIDEGKIWNAILTEGINTSEGRDLDFGKGRETYFFSDFSRGSSSFSGSLKHCPGKD